MGFDVQSRSDSARLEDSRIDLFSAFNPPCTKLVHGLRHSGLCAECRDDAVDDLFPQRFVVQPNQIDRAAPSCFPNRAPVHGR